MTKRASDVGIARYAPTSEREQGIWRSQIPVGRPTKRGLRKRSSFCYFPLTPGAFYDSFHELLGASFHLGDHVFFFSIVNSGSYSLTACQLPLDKLPQRLGGMHIHEETTSDVLVFHLQSEERRKGPAPEVYKLPAGCSFPFSGLHVGYYADKTDCERSAKDVSQHMVDDPSMFSEDFWDIPAPENNRAPNRHTPSRL